MYFQEASGPIVTNVQDNGAFVLLFPVRLRCDKSVHFDMVSTTHLLKTTKRQSCASRSKRLIEESSSLVGKSADCS